MTEQEEVIKCMAYGCEKEATDQCDECGLWYCQEHGRWESWGELGGYVVCEDCYLKLEEQEISN